MGRLRSAVQRVMAAVRRAVTFERAVRRLAPAPAVPYPGMLTPMELRRTQCLPDLSANRATGEFTIEGGATDTASALAVVRDALVAGAEVIDVRHQYRHALAPQSVRVRVRYPNGPLALTREIDARSGRVVWVTA